MTRPAPPRLVLASASPRRLALLRGAGLEPLVRVADIDERAAPGEDARDYVLRLARAKARAAARGSHEVVVGADTAVVVDGEPLGKPRDAAHAAALLARLSGRRHLVITGVAVSCGDGELRDLVVSTTVEMVALTPAAIAAYVATGEPFGKAGAYAIQGRAAAFVTRIEGSYTNVVGLPLTETLTLLGAACLPTPLRPGSPGPEAGGGTIRHG
ncbi:MAG TPA: Maf family protein [Egibacteraceae bacterium]